MKELLENVGSFLAATTAGLLLLSVSHEYGYFLLVGSRFQSFMTTTDYFSNAMLWLPVTLAVMAAWMDWNVIFGKRNYKFDKTVWSYIVIIMGVVTWVVGVFFLEEIIILLALAPLIILWMWHAPSRLPYRDSERPAFRMAHRIMVGLPAFALTAFAYGLSEGQVALVSIGQPYIVQMKGGASINRLILRSFDRGLLVRDPAETHIEFIKWDEVVKVYRFAPPERRMPLACVWFDIWCEERAPNP